MRIFFESIDDVANVIIVYYWVQPNIMGSSFRFTIKVFKVEFLPCFLIFWNVETIFVVKYNFRIDEYCIIILTSELNLKRLYCIRVDT